LLSINNKEYFPATNPTAGRVTATTARLLEDVTLVDYTADEIA